MTLPSALLPMAAVAVVVVVVVTVVDVVVDVVSTCGDFERIG